MRTSKIPKGYSSNTSHCHVMRKWHTTFSCLVLYLTCDDHSEPVFDICTLSTTRFNASRPLPHRPRYEVIDTVTHPNCQDEQDLARQLHTQQHVSKPLSNSRSPSQRPVVEASLKHRRTALTPDWRPERHLSRPPSAATSEPHQSTKRAHRRTHNH